MSIKRYDLETRAKLLLAFDGSGMTQKQFCSQHGVLPTTFQNWLYRKASKPKPLGFVRVQEAPPPREVAVSGSDEVTIAVGRHIVRFAKTPPAQYLAELLKSLAC